MRLLATALLFYLTTNIAYAGFERWTTTAKNNPFSGGVDVSVLYNVSRDAQVQVQCDSGEQGITIVAIPGYEVTGGVLSLEPAVNIAIDGEIILSDVKARISAFGANLVGIVIKLEKQNADKLTDGFLSAQSQIALDDGISTKPFLLTAKGSTSAAKKVKQCYQAQKGAGSEPVADDDMGKAERIAELKLEIEKLTQELKALEE
ncbi:MAG: hypothetical protein ABJN11_16060 [Lentilitoribacter sp.]